MTTRLLRMAVVAVTLFVFWLLLSGNYKTWLVASGAVCAVFVVLLSLRKDVTDPEGFPIEDLPRGLLYWPWLVWQIVLSALDVTRIILTPGRAYSPRVVSVEAMAGSPVGLTTYANSITLTPGTISVEVGERAHRIWVHAITRENAEGLANDSMNEWVAWMDGER